MQLEKPVTIELHIRKDERMLRFVRPGVFVEFGILPPWEVSMGAA